MAEETCHSPDTNKWRIRSMMGSSEEISSDESETGLPLSATYESSESKFPMNINNENGGKLGGAARDKQLSDGQCPTLGSKGNTLWVLTQQPQQPRHRDESCGQSETAGNADSGISKPIQQLQSGGKDTKQTATRGHKEET